MALSIADNLIEGTKKINSFCLKFCFLKKYGTLNFIYFPWPSLAIDGLKTRIKTPTSNTPIPAKAPQPV